MAVNTFYIRKTKKYPLPNGQRAFIPFMEIFLIFYGSKTLLCGCVFHSLSTQLCIDV